MVSSCHCALTQNQRLKDTHEFKSSVSSGTLPAQRVPSEPGPIPPPLPKPKPTLHFPTITPLCMTRRPNETISLPDSRIGLILESRRHGQRIAIIDAADYPRVSERRWTLLLDREGRPYVVMASAPGQLLQRFLLDPPPGKFVSFKDGDSLDCSRSNMRLATKGQATISRKLFRTNRTGFTGVHYVKKTGKWLAEIHAAGSQRYLGQFDTPELAARAYDSAALHQFGEFARLNFPADAKPEAPRRCVHNRHGYRGVSYYAHYRGESKWRAVITVKGKTTSLGYYPTIEEAARAYDRAVLEHRGPGHHVNFPREAEPTRE